MFTTSWSKPGANATVVDDGGPALTPHIPVIMIVAVDDPDVLECSTQRQRVGQWHQSEPKR